MEHMMYFFEDKTPEAEKRFTLIEVMVERDMSGVLTHYDFITKDSVDGKWKFQGQEFHTLEEAKEYIGELFKKDPPAHGAYAHPLQYAWNTPVTRLINQAHRGEQEAKAALKSSLHEIANRSKAEDIATLLYGWLIRSDSELDMALNKVGLRLEFTSMPEGG